MAYSEISNPGTVEEIPTLSATTTGRTNGSTGLTDGLLSETWRVWRDDYFERQNFTTWAVGADGRDISFPTAQDEPIKTIPPATIKQDVTSQEIAKAIAKNTKQIAQEVKKQTDQLEATIDQEERMLEMKERDIAQTKNHLVFYKKQTDRYERSDTENESEFEQMLDRIRLIEGIQSIVLDSRDRIIVTTTPLNVQQEDWDEPRCAGVYQIRIDFSAPDISGGVRVLNITQSFGQYDSPTISKGYCCWGNAKQDIQRDFYTQNLEELIIDMLSYISSPLTKHGYLGFEGDKSKGWEQFFVSATPRPEGFTWEMYERDNEQLEETGERNRIHVPTLEDSTLSNQTMEQLNTNIRAMSAPTELVIVSQQLAASQNQIRRLEQEIQQITPSPLSNYEQAILYMLRELGLREEAIAYHYRILLTGGSQISEMSLEQISANCYAIAVLRTDVQSNHEDRSQETFLPRSDLRPECVEELVQNSGRGRRIVTQREGSLLVIYPRRIEPMSIDASSLVTPSIREARYPIFGRDLPHPINSLPNPYSTNANPNIFPTSQRFNGLTREGATASTVTTLLDQHQTSSAAMGTMSVNAIQNRIQSNETAMQQAGEQISENQRLLHMLSDSLVPPEQMRESLHTAMFSPSEVRDALQNLTGGTE